MKFLCICYFNDEKFKNANCFNAVWPTVGTVCMQLSEREQIAEMIFCKKFCFINECVQEDCGLELNLQVEEEIM